MQNPGRVIDSHASYRDASGVLTPERRTTETMGTDYERLRAHLSEPRLHLYLTATAHRPDGALALYE